MMRTCQARHPLKSYLALTSVSDDTICCFSVTNVTVLVLEAAKRRILSLANFPGVPAHYTDEERQIYITSVIAFENPCMVCECVNGEY